MLDTSALGRDRRGRREHDERDGPPRERQQPDRARQRGLGLGDLAQQRREGGAHVDVAVGAQLAQRRSQRAVGVPGGDVDAAEGRAHGASLGQRQPGGVQRRLPAEPRGHVQASADRQEAVPLGERQRRRRRVGRVARQDQRREGAPEVRQRPAGHEVAVDAGDAGVGAVLGESDRHVVAWLQPPAAGNGVGQPQPLATRAGLVDVVEGSRPQHDPDLAEVLAPGAEHPQLLGQAEQRRRGQGSSAPHRRPDCRVGAVEPARLHEPERLDRQARCLRRRRLQRQGQRGVAGRRQKQRRGGRRQREHERAGRHGGTQRRQPHEQQGRLAPGGGGGPHYTTANPASSLSVDPHTSTRALTASSRWCCSPSTTQQ